MKTFLRTAIIFFWVLIIALIFYFPSWKAQVLPQYDKTLNIFAWGDVLDMETLSAFEKETGIKINLSFYASNEELQVKMQATGGEGYDLIMPSDYTVANLIKQDLLKPLDQKRLDFWNDLYPPLLDHPFDPGNRYSVPFEFEIYGFGVDTHYFQNRPTPDTWGAIFDPNQIDYKIAMKNDPIEVFQFAANYLFGPIDTVSNRQLNAIQNLLIEQSNWVVAYSDFRADYYIATGNAPIAISTIAYIKRIQRMFPHIHFIIPKEGSFLTIENFCISKTSEKENEIYTLLNYLYSPESMKRHTQQFFYLPASMNTIDSLRLEERELYQYSRKEFEKFQFFKNLVSQQKVRDLWVEVKSF